MRYVGDLVIEFHDARTIYLFEKNRCVVYHRWYSPLGSYKNWSAFRKRLWQYKRLDSPKVYRLASQFEIDYIVSDRRLDLRGKQVRQETPKNAS